MEGIGKSLIYYLSHFLLSSLFVATSLPFSIPISLSLVHNQQIENVVNLYAFVQSIIV
jgi:hypothetical protein